MHTVKFTPGSLYSRCGTGNESSFSPHFGHCIQGVALGNECTQFQLTPRSRYSGGGSRECTYFTTEPQDQLIPKN